jgi:protocatechuate 3,4-dioxygenase alpha subunit
MSLDNQSPELFGQTPWQTVGPFFHTSLPWKGGADLVGSSGIGARPDLIPEGHDLLRQQGARGAIAGQIIDIVGFVLDGEGAPVPDALIEIWQANAAGRYNSPADPRDTIAIEAAFTGFGRASTGEDGAYRFRTVLPGRVPGPGNSLQAPHAALSVLGRGLLKRLVTRIYFEDGEGNENDPILALAPAARRGALIARREERATYRFDIHLRGQYESVFFDV